MRRVLLAALLTLLALATTAQAGVNVFVGSATVPAALTDANVTALPGAATGALPGPVVTGNVTSCSGTNVTTATFSSAFASATGGATLCLAAGSYGTQTSLSKATAVTVKPQAGVAKSAVSIGLTGTSTNGVTLDGVTVTTASFGAGTYRNITIKNSDFSGQAIFESCASVNTSILLDTNNHINIAPNGYEGRIHFPGSGTGNCGATVQNSYFTLGCTDGIQDGAFGVRILNNEFYNIQQSYNGSDCSPWHTDSLQLWGADNTTVAGNYFHTVSDCIMGPDNSTGNNMLIENNICTGSGNADFTLSGMSGTTIRHNTLDGNLRVYGGNQGGANSGLTIENNIVRSGWYSTSSAGCAFSGSNTVRYNYGLPASATGSCPANSNAVTTAPTFTGGSSPGTLAGWQTTNTLTGSDATNIGATFPWPYTPATGTGQR